MPEILESGTVVKDKWGIHRIDKREMSEGENRSEE